MLLSSPFESWPRAVASVVLVLAVGWRLVDVDEWPTHFHPALQYESALAARAIWLAADPAEQTPDRRPWFDAVGFKHMVSPPALPALVAGCYLVADEEVPWVSKLFNGVFWLAAGGFAGAAAWRQTRSRWAGVVAFGWFVLTPFGLRVSRSFQTEPLLALGLAVAVWHLSRPRWQPTWGTVLTAGAVCGAAAFIKPGVLFLPLLAGFAALVLPVRVPEGRGRKLAYLAAFATLMVLPAGLYGAAVLRGHVENKVLPWLLTEGWFYKGVVSQIGSAVGWPVLVLALAGVWIAARAGNYLLVGLLTGYVGYVGVFTFHSATHDYYHVPLLVLASVGLGWPVARAERRLAGSLPPTRRSRVAIAAGAVLGLTGYLCKTGYPHLGPWRWTPDGQVERGQVAAWRERTLQAHRTAREVVGPGTPVVAVAEDLGYGLEFDAWVPVSFWPPQGVVPVMVQVGLLPDPFIPDKYLQSLVLDRGCRYAVITDLQEYDRQADLRAALARRGRLVVSTPEVVVWQFREASAAGEP